MSLNLSENDLLIYFSWSTQALRGLSPKAADLYLRENLATIKRVAQTLLNSVNFEPTEIYRGVILREKSKNLKLNPHPNFTYLSFSEQKEVAHSFADPSPKGFGSFHHLGDYGYVIRYLPRVDEILFHYSFFRLFPYEKAFVEFFGYSAKPFLQQEEVMILQPKEPFDLIQLAKFKLD